MSREQARAESHDAHGEAGPASASSGPSPGLPEPLVSIIVPTYNYGRMIGEALESLESQTYKNWECLVVDDGSTDDTAEVVAAYAARDSRFKYYRQPNQLQAAAKNLGLEHCAGHYVQFLDADDLVEARKLERQVEYLERHPEVDIVYGGVRYFRTGNVHERLFSMANDNLPWMPGVSGESRDILPSLVRGNIMVINSPLVRRGVIEAVGPFDRRLPPAEDWDYWLRSALAGARFRFAEVEGTLALVRAHPTSSSRNRIRMYRAMLLIRKKLEAALEDEELLALNRELSVADGAILGIEEASHGSSLRSAGHFGRAALMERRWKWRMKLLACALASPLVSEERLKIMVYSPLSQAFKSLRGKGDAA